LFKGPATEPGGDSRASLPPNVFMTVERQLKCQVHACAPSRKRNPPGRYAPAGAALI
jgi:hypothetical protein